jgi:hypothetical protein
MAVRRIVEDAAAEIDSPGRIVARPGSGYSSCAPPT